MDFDIRNGESVGLTVGFGPGERTADMSIVENVSEGVFYLLEKFLPTSVVSGAAYNRYGENKFSSDDWRLSVEKFADFWEHFPVRGGGLNREIFLDDDDFAWANSHLDEFEIGIKGFSRKISALSEVWSERFPSVFVFGV